MTIAPWPLELKMAENLQGITISLKLSSLEQLTPEIQKTSLFRNFLVHFLPIVPREKAFVIFFFFFFCSLWKRSCTPKRKVHSWANSCLSEQIPVCNGSKNIFDRVTSLARVLTLIMFVYVEVLHPTITEDHKETGPRFKVTSKGLVGQGIKPMTFGL